MAFFKRKSAESKETRPAALHELVKDRVLTAEGWRRRVLIKKPAKKSPSK